MVAIVATIVKPTNADGSPTRGMRAESFESMVNNTTSIIEDELSSLIEADYLDDVVSFKQSLSPTHDSIHGCVKAKDNVDLGIYISNAQDGQVHLCPGTIHFYNEIELDESLTLSCAGLRGSCILDGHGETRHFFSNTAGLTFSFLDLVFVNGLADDDSVKRAGGSLFFVGSGSTIIIDGSLFYNNRATSSSVNAVSIIFI